MREHYKDHNYPFSGGPNPKTNLGPWICQDEKLNGLVQGQYSIVGSGYVGLGKVQIKKGCPNETKNQKLFTK